MASSKAKTEPLRRSPLIIGLRVLAVALIILGFAGLIWAKNTGIPITADEPYHWDGKSTIMIAYHADYRGTEETCTVTSVHDSDWSPSTFHMHAGKNDLGGILAVRGESLLPKDYGEAIITCTKDGDRVLTGAEAIVGQFWLASIFLGVWMLVAAFIIHVRRLRKA